MPKFHFRLRSLFVVTAICALLAIPAFESVAKWVEDQKDANLTTTAAVVSVPNGGTVVYGGIPIHGASTRIRVSNPEFSNVMLIVTPEMKIQKEEEELPIGLTNH